MAHIIETMNLRDLRTEDFAKYTAEEVREIICDLLDILDARDREISNLIVRANRNEEKAKILDDIMTSKMN